MSRVERQWMMPDDHAPKMRLVRDEPETGATADPSGSESADGVDAGHMGMGMLQDMAADEGDAREDLGTLQLGFDRRAHRRFDVESLDVSIQRWGGGRDDQTVFGRVVDLSAGGVRLRTRQSGVRPDQQIRVRLELPNNGGIWPFVDTTGGQFRPKREWVGWLAVGRVTTLPDGSSEVGGRLVDMEDMDRGMLGLYLSTQPLAA